MITEEERALMLHMKKVSQDEDFMPPEALKISLSAAAELADMLRQQLPDVDDVTIARVILHLGGLLTPIMAQEKVGAILSTEIGLAAIHLAELELM